MEDTTHLPSPGIPKSSEPCWHSGHRFVTRARTYWSGGGLWPQVVQPLFVAFTYSSLPHMAVLYWALLRATLMGVLLPGFMLVTYEPAGGHVPACHGPPMFPAQDPAQPLSP